MDRQRLAYLSAASFLALVALAGIGAMFIVAPEGGTVTEATVPQAPATPVARVLPVDIATKGIAVAVTKAVQPDSTAAPVSSERSTRVCEREVTGWVRTESARIAGTQARVNVQVAGYRAGAASREYTALRAASEQCASLDADATQDRFISTRSDDDGQLAFGILRQGDVLTVVSATSRGTDPADIVNSALDSSESLLTPRLKGVCVDPSSTSDPSLAVRDPYTPNYDGFRQARAIALANQAPLSANQIVAVRASQPSTNWTAPSARPYPEYAEISDVQPDSAIGTVPGPGASPGPDVKRNAPPELVDPSLIRPPANPQPTAEVGDEPTLPAFGALSATAAVPVRDIAGPGCGWAFADTVAPHVSETDLAQGVHDAVVAALIDASARQTESMVEALTWPMRHETWVTNASNAADWDAYETASAAASADLTKAKADYEDSLSRWRLGYFTTPTPTPTTPLPSTSSSPTPSAGVQP